MIKVGIIGATGYAGGELGRTDEYAEKWTDRSAEVV